MTMDESFRPCRECGDNDQIVGGLGPYYVYCGYCAYCGPEAETEAGAIEAWNNREDA